MQQPQPQPSPAREHEERRRKKLEEEERQAAYLNGRRLLLPGSGGATGVAKLPQRGIELLWRAYELGHEAALWDLACCVGASAEQEQNSCEGPGSELNYAIDWSLAVPLYEAHARAGHPIAQKNLGTCYFRGWGVAQSIDQATALYEKAALQNYDVAQYNLGVCYRQGDGVDADSSRMLELYQKAADQGLHAAQCALAKCYLYGRGVPLDWAKATSIMTAAAEGYPAAMVILARWYEMGYNKLVPDTRKAMEYAIRAVYEKEIDAWDIFLRLLSCHYEEDKKGPARVVPSLFSISCDYIFQREIVGKCHMRTQLMQRNSSAVSRTKPTVERIESAGRRVLQRERLRRSRLLNVLPVDMQDKLRSDRSLCFSPWCSREFYGGGRVLRRFVQRRPTDHQREYEEGALLKCTLVGLPFSSPVFGRDDVVLSFCSMDCATFANQPTDDEHTLA